LQQECVARLGYPARRPDLPARPVGRSLVLTTVRFLALGTAAVVLAALHLRRPLLVCPFRTLTGIPCPMCGGTTAAMQVGSGEWLAAARTAPVVLATAAAFIIAPLGLGAWWRALPTRRQLVLLAIVGAGAQCWQVLRLGVGTA